VKVHEERKLERDGRTLTYRLVEDENSVGWVRGETVEEELIGEPQAIQVAEELGGEVGQAVQPDG
jgi:hypothetical protein